MTVTIGACVLYGCGGSDSEGERNVASQSQPSPTSNLPAQATSQPPTSGADDTDTIFDVELTGSVGDGPIVDAQLTVFAKSGKTLDVSVSDQSAKYDIQMQTREEDYPLVIEARGGVDLVTNLPPTFMLSSAVTEPRTKAVANINPFTTLAIATTREMNGGLSTDNIISALTTVVTQFNCGLTSLTNLDPMTTPVDASNIAEIVKASETLAEILRRTHAVVFAARGNSSVDDVIVAIGSDLIDGVLDGRGGQNTDSSVSAATIIISAQVLLESMTNSLQVGGQPISTRLDDIINLLASGSTPELTGSRPVTAGMIESAKIGVAAALAISSSQPLRALQTAIGTLTPGMLPSAVVDALPTASVATLDLAIARVASGVVADLDVVNSISRDGIPAPSINSPPVISGTPATAVLQDMPYAFTPNASDPDGDDSLLAFSITNQPSWANFSAATGQLAGTPSAGDIGTYQEIVISVSDGQTSTSLLPYSIAVDAIALGTATLDWLPPTTNMDGSPLANLAGYRIYWGTTPDIYPNSVTVNNPGVASYTVESLVPSTYYFVTTAFNTSGNESEFSNMAQKTIP